MRSSLFVAAFLLFLFFLSMPGQAEAEFDRDVIETVQGPLEVTFIGPGTLMFALGGKVIHVDPVNREADYGKMPKADLILITHEHGEHLDPQAIAHIRTEKTTVVLTERCATKISGGVVMKNGEVRTLQGLRIEAVTAYN